MGLGSVRAVSLAKARELAATARESLAQGIDPLDVRRQAEVEAEAARTAAEEEAAASERAAVTFGRCADELIKSMSPAWRNSKHAAQWPSTLETYAASLHGMSVAAVDTEAMLACLRPIWTAKPETASRGRGRIEKVLDYARAKGLRSGENPARWQGAWINPASSEKADARPSRGNSLSASTRSIAPAPRAGCRRRRHPPMPRERL